MSEDKPKYENKKEEFKELEDYMLLQHTQPNSSRLEHSQGWREATSEALHFLRKQKSNSEIYLDKKIKAKVVRYIRVLFRQSEQYKLAKDRAIHPTEKGPRGGKMWKCQNPKCEKALKSNEVQIDHIEPIVPIGKKQADMTIDEYVSRLFCSADNLQCMCHECHLEKSKEEREKRK